jgi:hypothetical protein
MSGAHQPAMRLGPLVALALAAGCGSGASQPRPRPSRVDPVVAPPARIRAPASAILFEDVDNSGKRSRLAEMPLPPVEGTRELMARYRMHRGGEYAGEQRLTIDRAADGQRVITAEMLSSTGAERVRVEAGDGLGSRIRHESAAGLLELRRDQRKLNATFTPTAGGAPMKATFDMPRGATFNLSGLAADHLLYPAAMRLRPGGQTTAQLVQVVVGSRLTLERGILRLLRRPDRKDRPGLRLFSISITARNQTIKGELVLDQDGHLVEQEFLGEVTRRAAPASSPSDLDR